MKIKADFHIHTADDPVDSIGHSERQLISAAAKRGFKALAITNHNKLTYDREIANYASDHGISLIPGIEKSVEGKHVLILNATYAAEKIDTFQDLRIAKEQDDIFVVAPHPFFKKKFCLEGRLLEHIDLFDAIEFTFFYSRWINFNQKAVRMAEEHNLPLVGNSDSHSLRNLGSCYSLIQSSKLTVESILEALRNRRVEVVSRPMSFTGMLWSYLILQYYLYKNGVGKKRAVFRPKKILAYIRSTLP